MNQRFALLLLISLPMLLAATGCQSPFYADRLAALGGLTGAATGAAIGSKSGNAAEGAVVGAAVGAVTGGAVGDSIDQDIARNQALIEKQLGRRMAHQVTNADLIAMSQAGLSDQVIITHIQAHGVTKPPTAADLIRLNQQGVSDAVLEAAQNVSKNAPVITGPVIVEER